MWQFTIRVLGGIAIVGRVMGCDCGVRMTHSVYLRGMSTGKL